MGTAYNLGADRKAITGLFDSCLRELPMNNETRKKPGFKPAVIVLLGIGLFIAALLLRLAGLANAPVQIDPRQGRLLKPPLTVPAFALVDHRGQPFTEQQLQGRWTLALVGFTYCPDVCPLGLAMVSEFYHLLDASVPVDRQPAFLFISVDPFRDTQEILGEYVTFYRDQFVGLTGPPEAISALMEGIGLYYAYADPGGTTIFKDVLRRPQPEKYAVVHSAELLFINPEGKIELMMIPPFKAADIANLYDKLRKREGGRP
jgi:protein SCO1/2